MIEYIGLGKTSSISGTGAFYGHPHQLLVQFLAALTIIIWDGAVTFVIWMFIKYVLRIKLRLTDEELAVGDVAIHGEEAYPARRSTPPAQRHCARRRPRRRRRSRAGSASRSNPESRATLRP